MATRPLTIHELTNYASENVVGSQLSAPSLHDLLVLPMELLNQA